MKPNAPPTCKITIAWSDDQHLTFEIDQTANCADSAGAGFYDKSTAFGPEDFVGNVTGELDDTDKFYNGPRCDKPRRRSTAPAGNGR